MRGDLSRLDERWLEQVIWEMTWAGYEWAVKWKMCFNPDPTKPAAEVIFTNKNSTTYETVTFASVNGEPVLYHKHLGFVSLS